MDGNTIMMTVAAILILISAVLYFAATFLGNAKKKGSSNNEGQNELVVELKKQNALIQSQMEKLEREIRVLAGKQENQAKAIIKYNKENARQLAVSERDTLMRVMQELKQAIENNAGSVGVREVPEAVPVMEAVPEAELFEVSELPADEEESLPEEPSLEDLLVAETEEVPSLEDPFAAEIEETETPELSEDLDMASLFAGMAEEEPEPAMEEIQDVLNDIMIEEPSLEDLFATELPESSETPEFSDELDLSSLFAEMEKEAMPIVAEESKQESAPAADPMAGFGSDPNAMMTPEDIARLLEAMGQ